MQIRSLTKLVIAIITASQLSACGVLAVGGVAAGASVLADRRTPGVQAIDKGLQLSFAERALKTIDRLATQKGIDGGDRLDPELAGQRLVLVDIDLDQRDSIGIGSDGAFQHRCQRLARAAPFGPEIDEHEHRFRCIDDIAAKGFDAGFFAGGGGKAGQDDALCL